MTKNAIATPETHKKQSRFRLQNVVGTPIRCGLDKQGFLIGAPTRNRADALTTHKTSILIGAPTGIRTWFALQRQDEPSVCGTCPRELAYFCCLQH